MRLGINMPLVSGEEVWPGVHQKKMVIHCDELCKK